MNRTISAFKGAETWWTSFRMGMGMHVFIIKMVFMLHLSLTIYFCWQRIDYHYYHYAFEYLFALFKFKVMNQPYIISEETHLWGMAIFSLIGRYLFLSSFVWLAWPVTVAIFRNRTKKQLLKKYIRGAKLLTENELKKEIKRKKEKVGIAIGNIRVPVSAEPKHFYVIGRPGVGKTTFFMEMLKYLRKQYGRGIIYDYKGDYLSKLYNLETDMIFNPLDKRCLIPHGGGWSIFNEIRSVMDIEAIAASLIPQSYNADPFWNDGARDVLIGLMHYLYQNNRTTNTDIWKAVSAPAKEISKWLKNTRGGERGYSYVQDASSKQALSILAVMMQYTKAFEYMSGRDGSFSIDEWLANENGGWIFITNYSKIRDSLKPVLSLFIDLIGKKLLSLPDDINRRIPISLDETITLQRMPTLLELLTNSRSKGGCIFLGVQENSQVSKTYSPDIQKSIFNACSNRIMFAVNEPVTAKDLSDSIGETEYWETDETSTIGPKDMRDGLSMSRKKRREQLIIPSQILTMEELKCYVKIPNYHLTPTSLTLPGKGIIPIKKILTQCGVIKNKSTEPFLIRDDLSLEKVINDQKEVADAVKESLPKEMTSENVDKLFEDYEKDVITVTESEENKLKDKDVEMI